MIKKNKENFLIVLNDNKMVIILKYSNYNSFVLPYSSHLLEILAFQTAHLSTTYEGDAIGLLGRPTILITDSQRYIEELAKLTSENDQEAT